MPTQTPALFAGISGVELEIAEGYALGRGISLSPTYAHIFAPYMMAFSPPLQKGEAHPPPWKAVSGGLKYDVNVELRIPLDLDIGKGFNHFHALWLIVALLRLKVSPVLAVPVISTVSFSTAKDESVEARLFPMEMMPGLVSKKDGSAIYISRSDVDWLETHWLIANRLMVESKSFARALKSFDGSHFSKVAADAIIVLWGALEQLFSKKEQELSFRASAVVACYLEPPGEERERLYKAVRTLYGQRSKVAHGAELNEQSACEETYELVARCLLKMIEMASVPSVAELEQNIFDNRLWR
jgi:hypothetical protein